MELQPRARFTICSTYGKCQGPHTSKLRSVLETHFFARKALIFTKIENDQIFMQKSGIAGSRASLLVNPAPGPVCSILSIIVGDWGMGFCNG